MTVPKNENLDLSSLDTANCDQIVTMKILVVEDQPLILKSLCYTLDKRGYHSIAAIDGMQGKEFYQQEKPNIVIVDLLLPYVTGQELIEHIRSIEESYTKIIALSSMFRPDTIQHLFELGVDDFMRKPFIPMELLQRIERLVRYDLN